MTEYAVRMGEQETIENIIRYTEMEYTTLETSPKLECNIKLDMKERAFNSVE
jgi:hypothetical protein